MPDSDGLTWEKFILESPAFPGLYHKAFKLVPVLVLETFPAEDDTAGIVLLQLMIASMSDFDDIMTLSSQNGHWGALKLLRCAFERTVTLKYIAQNPTEAEAFFQFDALDWQRILVGIESRTGLRMSEKSQKNLDQAAEEARKKFRQQPCDKCGLRKQTTWTPMSVKDLSKRVGMDYIFFESYEMPSKFIHPTYWGTHQVTNAPPVYNTLKHTHEIVLESVLTHQRYFRKEEPVSPRVLEIVDDFFSVWKFSETDFGLPPGTLQFVPKPLPE